MSDHCDKCDYVTSNPSSLLNHIKAVHEKVKRFHCDLCDYACYYGYDLKKHKQFHENNPLFEGKQHLWTTNKLQNKNSNHEEKCNLCDFTVKNPFALKQHIESVHEKVKKYYCDVCNFGFYHSFGLKKHYKRIHGKDLLLKDLANYQPTKEKIYYTLPRPKRGKWIVILERL